MSLFLKLFAVLLCLPLLLSCSSDKPPIRVGVVLPLSGAFQIYGEQGLKGAQLAVEKINAEGGVLGGYPLELVVRDNETIPAEAVRYSRELIQIENVFALLGPVSSSARYAMSEVAAQHKVPQLYGIDYEGEHYNRYLICYSTIPEHYVSPIIPYLNDNYGGSFYIFGYDYIWPHKMSDRILSEVEKVGGVVSGIEFTPFAVKDYTPVFQRIEASGARNLLLILPGNDGFNFLTQMSKFSFGRPLTTFAFAADESYLKAVPSEALDGVYTALHFISSWQSPAFQRFVAQYQERFGEQVSVTYSSKSHYDLIYLLKSAIEKAGSLDREQAASALQGLKLYSGQETVALREDHHFDLPMFLGQFNQKSLNVIKPLGTIRPSDQRVGH